MDAPENEKVDLLFRRSLGENHFRKKGCPPDLGEWDWLICPAWREIRYAFIHFQDWLVVLGCAALLEYCAKDKAYEATFGLNWEGARREDFFKKTNLLKALKICQGKKVMTDTRAKQIREYCKDKRDLISHMNAAAFGKDKVYPYMHMLDLKTNLFSIKKNVPAQDNPVASDTAFWEAVNNLSVEIVHQTHTIIESLYADTIDRAAKGQLGGGVFYTPDKT